MASYKIEWKRSAVKELRLLPDDAIEKIIGAVEQLAENPLPSKVRKLVGSEYTYRIRTGDYRVVYTITSSTLTIDIVRVGHRKDVYERY
jgi:mRNA interferase RelE/StbE